MNVDENRIKTIVGDLSLPRFGMSMKQWFDLEETIDVVVHNGVRFSIVWLVFVKKFFEKKKQAIVNTLMPFDALKSANVDGTLRCVRLCGSKRVKPLIFM